ncbi:hypothetical protein K8T06_03930, partial [bacterium]|nr:hypothetical protein [bacterium]
MGAIFGIAGRYSETDIERMSAMLSHRGIGEPIVTRKDNGFIACFHQGNKTILDDDLAIVVDGYLETDNNLNGLFTCAQFNTRTGELKLLRDPSGARPLYTVKTHDRFAFASVPTALLALDDVSRELNPEGVSLYMTMVCLPDPVTIYRKIQMLRPGKQLIYSDGQIKISSFWTAPWKSSETSLLPQTAAVDLRKAMDLAVKSAMPDNLEKTGFFLSGGTDTGAVVALAAQTGRGPLKTFTIGYEGEGSGYDDYNEFRYARLIADHYGTTHHECYISPDSVKKSLPGIIADLHQPSGDAINTYLVAGTLPDEIETVLTGTGGDEVFIGSHWFKQQARLIEACNRWK